MSSESVPPSVFAAVRYWGLSPVRQVHVPLSHSQSPIPPKSPTISAEPSPSTSAASRKSGLSGVR